MGHAIQPFTRCGRRTVPGKRYDAERSRCGGRRVQGQIHLTETVHPHCVGIGGCAGHWVKTLPVALGKGVFFNGLLEIDWEHTSPINLNLDTCVKVRIRP